MSLINKDETFFHYKNIYEMFIVSTDDSMLMERLLQSTHMSNDCLNRANWLARGKSPSIQKVLLQLQAKL